MIGVNILSNQSCRYMRMCQVEMEKGAEALNNDMGTQGIGAIKHLNKLMVDRNFSNSGNRRDEIVCHLYVAFSIVQVFDYTS